MSQLALLLLAGILAGFALMITPELSAGFISGQLADLIPAIGAIAVIFLALSLIYLAIKSLFNRPGK